jgi:AraC family transcriptional regulator
VNRVTPLWQTPAVRLERFDHEPGVTHRDPEREHAATHAVNFVESGSFRVRVAGAWHDLTAAHLLATTPGLEFACAHDEDQPRDRCLSVRYSEEAIESLRAAGARPAPGSVLRLSNRGAYLKHELRGCTGPEGAEAMAGALYWSLATPPSARAPFRPGQQAWHAARVDRAKALMRAHYAEPLTLSRLAREVGMSLYHFARVFADLEGRPPHRFLQEVRLAQARARLRAGASVTDTCFAVGFGSLSHFVTTFRRRFGLRPSDARR